MATKKYEIIFNLSTLHGRSKTVPFTGTYAAARDYAWEYAHKHHLTPEQVYIREMAVA